jgi:ABC-type amino acid transport substrate-binding protein
LEIIDKKKIMKIYLLEVRIVQVIQVNNSSREGWSMKRFYAFFAVLVVGTSVFAQALKVGTTDSTARFAPLIQKVLREGGIEAEIASLAQDRLLEDLTAGRIDGAFFLSEPSFSSLAGIVKVPVKLYMIDFVAVTLDPGVKVAKTSDLRKYSVGMIQGNTAQEQITKGMKPIATWNEAAEFKMLAAGRFDVALAARSEVPNLSKAEGIDTYYVQEPALLSTPTYFALSSANAGIQSKLTAVFRKWVDSGKWMEELSRIAAE